MEGICKRKACFWILLIWKSASDKNSHTPCNFFQLLPLMKNLQCAHTRWYKYRDLPFLWDVPRYCRWFEIPDDWFFCSLFYFSLFFTGFGLIKLPLSSRIEKFNFFKCKTPYFSCYLPSFTFIFLIIYLFGIILLLSSSTVCSHFRIAATSLSVWSQCCPFSTKFSRQLFSSENLFTILYGIISSWVPYKIFVSLQIDFTGCSRTQHK